MSDIIRCSRCDSDLPTEAFAPSHRTQGGWCRQCRQEYMATYTARRPKPPLAPCRDCQSEYERWCTWTKPGAAARRCRDCYNAYYRKIQTPDESRRKPPPLTHGAKPTGKRWRTMQLEVWATEPNCGICGEYVDQTLHHHDPMARSVDHIIPIWNGGAMYERSNLRMAHRSCNSKAGNASRADWERQRVALTRAALWIAQRLAA